MANLPRVARWGFDTGPTGDRDLRLSDDEGNIVLTFLQATANLTEADVRALASLIDAQQAEIDTLRARIRDLERSGKD